jgi:deoxyribodipyrimidine photolyase
MTNTMINPHIGEAHHQLLHAYRRSMRQSYQEAGIDLAVAHIRALKVIHHHQQSAQEPCTARLIAVSIERDKAQITRLVKDLLSVYLQLLETRRPGRRAQGAETGTRLSLAPRQSHPQAG